MTNWEKINALREVQNYREDISSILVRIIKDTSDHYCNNIYNFSIGNDSISVYYEYTFLGGRFGDEVSVPIEWLDEGFDYKTAYNRQVKLAKKREEARKKRCLDNLRKARARLRKKQEYKKQLLALKKKYEGGEQ